MKKQKKTKTKKKKIIWSSHVNRDIAYDLGFHMGVRATLEFLAEECFIDPSIIAWLIEERYFQEIKRKR